MHNARLNTIEPLFLRNNHTTAWRRSTNDREEDKEGLGGYGSVGLHTTSMIVAREERVFKCRTKETPPFGRGHKDGQSGDCPFHSGGLYIHA